MSDEVAALGLAVDSGPVKDATKDLKDFAKTADDTAQSTDNLNEKLSTTGKSFTSNADQIAAAAKQQGASSSEIEARIKATSNAYDSQADSMGAVRTAMAGMTDTQLGLATVITGVTVGVLAAGAAVGVMAYQFQSAQEVVQQALIGIGQRSGATIDDINRISQASATATGLSVDQARNIATEFAKTGNIGVASIQGLTDATQGFSILIGKDATKAGADLAKIMGGDLVKAATDLNSVYGTIDGKTLEYIRTLQNQGESEKAIQVILDNIAPTNQKAVESLGTLERAWAAVGNAVSATKNAIGSIGAPAPLQQQIASKQTDLTNLQSGAQSLSPDMQTLTGGGDQSAAIAKTMAELDALQQALNTFNADAADKQLIKLANDADAVDKAIIPQIAQIQKLEAELGKLQAAQANPDVAGRQGSADQNNAAVVAIQNQIASLKEAQGDAERYNERVKEISGSWGDVSQATALVLQRSQNNLPVIEAIGGAAKMAAQYTADYANAMDQGKTATDATALASDHLANTQAQINAGAKEQLFNLQNQAAAAGAVTGAEQIAAQGQATFNSLVHQGVDETLAQAVATQQVSNATAKATAAVLNQTQAVKDQTAMLEAQQNGTVAVTAASIAYDRAIDSGASSAAAAALSSATFVLESEKAAIAWQKTADAAAEAAYNIDHAANIAAASTFDGGTFNGSGNQTSGPAEAGSLQTNMALRAQAQSESIGVSGLVDNSILSGGLSAALTTAKNAPNTYGANPLETAALAPLGYDLTKILGPQRSNIDDKMTAVDNLTQIQNAQTGDKSVQVSNLQSEMAWLNTLPETIARDQKIVSLQQSIDSLKNATDANTAATQATLNPLYSQGHGALAIGYYKAASGLDVMAQGPSSGDTIPFHAMVNGGERIQITPKGQVSNDNSRSAPQIINNNTNFVFNDTKTNNARRSQRQFAQGFGQAAAAMGR